MVYKICFFLTDAFPNGQKNSKKKVAESVVKPLAQQGPGVPFFLSSLSATLHHSEADAIYFLTYFFYLLLLLLISSGQSKADGHYLPAAGLLSSER